VPGDEAGAAWLLDEEVGGPAEDVGTDHVGHGVEDRRMVNELVGPGEEQMRLVPQVALQRRAGDRLVLLEPASVAGGIGGAHDADRKDAAVALEVGDLSLGEMHETYYICDMSASSNPPPPIRRRRAAQKPRVMIRLANAAA
jgi:hypothetical protein